MTPPLSTTEVVVIGIAFITLLLAGLSLLATWPLIRRRLL